MRIEIYLDEKEYETPIKVADALIENYVRDCNDEYLIKLGQKTLAEIAEHIQVFLKHNSFSEV